MKFEILNKVEEILARVSGRDVKSINPEGELKLEINLDSIQVVELFAMLEKEFEVELPLELMNVKTGKQFIERLEDCLEKSTNKA